MESIGDLEAGSRWVQQVLHHVSSIPQNEYREGAAKCSLAQYSSLLYHNCDIWQSLIQQLVQSGEASGIINYCILIPLSTESTSLEGTVFQPPPLLPTQQQLWLTQQPQHRTAGAAGRTNSTARGMNGLCNVFETE